MRGALLTCAVSLLAGSAAAGDPFLDAEVVDAVKVSAVPLEPASPLWDQAPQRSFAVTPQQSVHLNDRAANAALASARAGTVRVRALVSASELGVQVEWADDTANAQRVDEVNTFADSVAMQVPVRFGAGQRLPYVGMGDPGMPVLLALVRAGPGGAAVVSTSVAAGFGSLTRTAEVPRVEGSLARDEAGKVYRAVLRRRLEERGHSLAAGLVPVAWAVWDGRRVERGGYKQLSRWHFIRLPGLPVDPAYLAEVSFGYRPGDLGDAARGKVTAETICIACHHLPGKRIAPAGVAPDLSAIGAIATPGYLRSSIVAPSEVVVHNLQINNHYMPSGTPDRHGARPNADMYTWAIAGAEGAPVSKMPPFTTLDDGQVKDLVAFLTTLTGATE